MKIGLNSYSGETIKQMENAIKPIKIFIGVILLCLIPKTSFSLQRSSLDDEMYSIITSSFQYSNESRIILHSKTMNYEGWMGELWSKDIFDKEGVGFCVFEDAELKKAFDELRGRINDLVSKSLLSDQLEDRYILKSSKKAEGMLILSEPIVIGKYSFLFRKTKSTKSLYVQKINSHGNWEYECGVTLSGELH